jgi:hypothetical protein
LKTVGAFLSARCPETPIEVFSASAPPFAGSWQLEQAKLSSRDKRVSWNRRLPSATFLASSGSERGIGEIGSAPDRTLNDGGLSCAGDPEERKTLPACHNKATAAQAISTAGMTRRFMDR